MSEEKKPCDRKSGIPRSPLKQERGKGWSRKEGACSECIFVSKQKKRKEKIVAIGECTRGTGRGSWSKKGTSESKLDIHAHKRAIEFAMEFFLFGSGAEGAADGHGFSFTELALSGRG